MPRSPERQPSLGQKEFAPPDGKGEFGTATDLAQEYPVLTGYLSEQKMWRSGMTLKDRAGFLDAEQGKAHIFRRHNWQSEKATSLDGFEPEGELSGLVAIIPPSWVAKAREILSATAPILAPHAPVYVLERRAGGKVAKSERLTVMEEVGLAIKSVLTRPSRKKGADINQFAVWRARIPTEWKTREPINLLDGPAWRQNWIRKLIAKAGASYRHEGLKPLNAFAAGEELRATTYPKKTIGAVKLGFGFELEANCGCRAKIDMDGGWSTVFHCGDSDCDSFSGD